MRLHLTDEDRAFRAELRTFLPTAVPSGVRDAVATGQELTRDEIVTAQRILNDAGRVRELILEKLS